jgi:hypothetical protein
MTCPHCGKEARWIGFQWGAYEGWQPIEDWQCGLIEAADNWPVEFSNIRLSAMHHIDVCEHCKEAIS